MMLGATGADAAWDGCHVGASAGFGRLDLAVKKTTSFASTPARADNSDGLSGGVAAGCDVAFPTFVVGVGASYDLGEIAAKRTATRHLALPGNTLDGALSIESRAKAIGAVSGRIGVPVGAFLIFARVGFAIAQVDTDYHSLFTATRFATSSEETLSGAKTRQGYLLGAGVEYALGPTLSIRLEYDRYDFGTCNCVVSGQQVSKGMGNVLTRAFSTRFSDNLTTDTLKIGVFYRF